MRHVRELRKFGLAGLLALAIVAPSVVAQAQQSQKGAGGQQGGRISVAAADSFVGRQLQDSSGGTGGTVNFLLVVPSTGQVQALIVGSNGALDLGVQYVTVPWHDVESVAPGSGPIHINVGFDQLRQGQKISAQALNDLSRPEVWTSVVNAYETSGGQQQAQAGRQGQAKSQPQMLIGRDVIATLVAPTATPTSQIRGAEVLTPSGRDVGEIEHVIIDTTHGQVAYVILGRGGFLGLDEDWVPVPMQSLSWIPDSGNYVVNASEQAIEKLPALKRSDLPSSFKISQLRGLYQSFALAPYWPQTAEAPDSEQKGTGK